MAKIKGLEIKGLKNYRGHEGEPLHQGNIYLNGKKVGFYSEGDWGGPATVDYDTKEAKDEIKVIVDLYFKENPPEYDFANTDEYFFRDLVSLLLDEKDFKAAIKRGYAMLFVADAKYEAGKPLLIPQVYSIPEHLTTPDEMDKFRGELLAKGYNKFKEYNTLADFIIN